jgi:SNF2 family DNA or RNA helicase
VVENHNIPSDRLADPKLRIPSLLKWNFWTFAKKHIKRAPNNMVVGYRDVETVKKAISQVCLRRLKADCLDLPDKVFETRTVELGPDERRAYNMMKEDMRAWFETVEGEPTVTEAATFATKLTRLRQISDGLVSEGMDGAQAWSKSLTKIKEVWELWRDAGQPYMVVWVQYVPVGQRIAEEGGTSVPFLSGLVQSIDERTRMQTQWERNGGLFVSQMDVGGEGLNLQAASLQVFVDVPWTPKQRLQCVDRLHRIGQNETVVIVDVLAQDTVDSMLMRRLQSRIKDAESLTEGAVAKWSRAEMEEVLR